MYSLSGIIPLLLFLSQWVWWCIGEYIFLIFLVIFLFLILNTKWCGISFFSKFESWIFYFDICTFKVWLYNDKLIYVLEYSLNVLTMCVQCMWWNFMNRWMKVQQLPSKFVPQIYLNILRKYNPTPQLYPVHLVNHLLAVFFFDLGN